VFMLSVAVAPGLNRQALDAGIPGLSRLEQFTADVRRYLVITTTANFLVGLANTIFLIVLRVDYALLWGLLAAILGYIPVVGFWVAMIPPLIIAYLDHGLTTAVIVLIGYILINGTAENLIKPRMLGEGLRVSPLVVFIGLFTWGFLLGGVGALLAVPLTLLILSLLDSFDTTSWLASLARLGTGPREEGAVKEAMRRVNDLWGSLTRFAGSGRTTGQPDGGATIPAAPDTAAPPEDTKASPE
jgi:predicted PurR-regulated permease PerM